MRFVSNLCKATVIYGSLSVLNWGFGICDMTIVECENLKRPCALLLQRNSLSDAEVNFNQFWTLTHIHASKFILSVISIPTPINQQWYCLVFLSQPPCK